MIRRTPPVVNAEPPLQVLIVEDAPDDARLLVEYLREASFSFEHEVVDDRKGYEAALKRGGWDLILCDYRLPDIDATEALALLRASDPDLPFILVSGRIGESAAAGAMRAGAHDFVMKSALSRLPAVVERELRDAETRRESRRAESALRRSQELFRDIADTIQEVFWIRDARDHRVLFVSTAFETVFGRPPDAVLADAGAFLEYVHPEDKARFRALEPHRLEGRSDLDYRIVRPDGTVRWIHSRSFPVLDASGHVVRVVGAAEDVTERRALEDRMQHAMKMEAVGRLAGGVAHDFNNVLTVVLGLAETLLLDKQPGHPDQAPLREICSAALRGAGISRQLLAFSRREPFEPRLMDVNPSVQGLVKLLHRLIGEDVEVRTNLGTGPLAVEADAGQLEQALVNLAVNARDAMPEGGTLTLATEAVVTGASPAQHAGLPAGAWVMVSVNDTGTGMDAETMRHLFEPFFTTKQPGKGTGLGLATVHGVVEQARGHLCVHSTLGRGSRFEIFLPAGDAALLPRFAGSEASAVRGGCETLLVVEDDRPVRDLVVAFLRSLGYTVLAPETSIDAVDMANGHPGPIDAVITDVVMPQVGGPEVVRRLLGLRPDICVLFMTGYNDDHALRQRVISDGALLLQKPFSMDELARVVRKCLDRG
jgi:PAS domain S-box-containing protein